jgi:hypothetical protein
MNISDTFYIALCMTILIIGVVYWFWTQNQYIQRKLNLLENIVYEMKTSLNNAPETLPNESTKAYPPPPSSELEEEDDRLHKELHAELLRPNVPTVSSLPAVSEIPDISDIPDVSEIPTQFVEQAPMEPMSTMEDSSPILPYEDVQSEDALQPGGVGNTLSMELPADSTGSSLDAMTLKELKRMAEQRKIVGWSNMRKQALIDALRNTVSKDGGFVDTVPS